MKSIHSKGFTLYFGADSISALKTFLKKRTFSRCFIFGDENSMQHCLPDLILQCPALAAADLLEVESGEQNKNLVTCEGVWETLLEQGADRHCLFINLGGGVISDMGGFIASLYKRGIPFIHIPTTLLAMADACLGGKNAVDFAGIKNSLGTVNQPEAVFVCPPFLNSLDERQVLNGWVEVFKMALIADKKMWLGLSKLSQVKDPSAFIFRALELKNKVVLKDPFDKAERKILNFGHSLGHAIEALVLEEGEDLLHGAAVCTGMMLESHISMQKKLISAKDHHSINERLINTFGPMNLIPFDHEEILQKLRQDKKNQKGKFFFSLLTGIGSCRFDVEVTEKQIVKALEAYP
ncbi:MAG TPA: 3-dehydroquinate synthase family protein [Bacteroidia bacterium]|nr:3-dehydroquinate synthase family protein [Bacteroidia bacterium]